MFFVLAIFCNINNDVSRGASENTLCLWFHNVVTAPILRQLRNANFRRNMSRPYSINSYLRIRAKFHLCIDSNQTLIDMQSISVKTPFPNFVNEIYVWPHANKISMKHFYNTFPFYKKPPTYSMWFRQNLHPRESNAPRPNRLSDPQQTNSHRNPHISHNSFDRKNTVAHVKFIAPLWKFLIISAINPVFRFSRYHYYHFSTQASQTAADIKW